MNIREFLEQSSVEEIRTALYLVMSMPMIDNVRVHYFTGYPDINSWLLSMTKEECIAVLVFIVDSRFVYMTDPKMSPELIRYISTETVLEGMSEDLQLYTETSAFKKFTTPAGRDWYRQRSEANPDRQVFMTTVNVPTHGSKAYGTRLIELIASNGNYFIPLIAPYYIPVGIAYLAIMESRRRMRMHAENVYLVEATNG